MGGETEGLEIRPAAPGDETGIWRVIGPTIRAGETYALDRDLPETQALAYWLRQDQETFVAELGGDIVGTYYIRANQAGGGSHVANCGYMTAPEATGRGVARTMCIHSLDHARRRGFRAMQFNFVVSTNERALNLWLAMGFGVVGKLPEAFEHPVEGLVDALVLYKKL